MSIRAAILGPTSYTGLYLMQLLLRHPAARLTYLASQRENPPDIVEEFPQLLHRFAASSGGAPGGGGMPCRPIDPAAIAKEADVVFLCVPHVVAMSYVPDLLDAGLRVIDLSADYRLADAALYEKTYGHAHSDPENLKLAAYGLPEFFADHIADAQLVANPGCYPTAAVLGIAPLLVRSLVQATGIIVNGASGVSGAGRAMKANLQYMEMNESYYAYGAIGGHRHQPEMEQALSLLKGQSVPVLFVPHLLPIDRGILQTIYLAPLDEEVTEDELFTAFDEAYDDQPFVRVRPDLPNVKYVRDTNYCDISVRRVGKHVVVFSALDNMIKGASGQAVQNMNLMFDQDQTAGLL